MARVNQCLMLAGSLRGAQGRGRGPRPPRWAGANGRQAAMTGPCGTQCWHSSMLPTRRCRLAFALLPTTRRHDQTPTRVPAGPGRGMRETRWPTSQAACHARQPQGSRPGRPTNLQFHHPGGLTQRPRPVHVCSGRPRCSARGGGRLHRPIGGNGRRHGLRIFYQTAPPQVSYAKTVIFVRA